MLKVAELTKKYGNTLAVDHVTFEVAEGEIAVLLGPNGAGKTTTLKCIAGLLRYQGTIEIDGYLNKSINAKKIFSYVPETPALYDMLTVYEHLEFIAHAYHIVDYKGSAEELLKRFDLIDMKNKLGKELSKGMQQKVSLCCALLVNPRLVLFDEPMIGLDPRAIKELKKAVLELGQKGCSAVISTHIIDSVEGIWDRVLVMNKGSIVASRSRKELEQTGESLEELFFRMTEQ